MRETDVRRTRNGLTVPEIQACEDVGQLKAIARVTRRSLTESALTPEQFNAEAARLRVTRKRLTQLMHERPPKARPQVGDWCDFTDLAAAMCAHCLGHHDDTDTKET